MNRVGVRELRREASAILRRVGAGETVEVTDRGRPVATMVRTMPSGLDRLESEGMIRPAGGDLLALEPVKPARDIPLPSQLIDESRAD